MRQNNFACAEQGFGDVIHFVRYVPLVAARGGKIILECHNELLKLMGAIDGIERVVSIDEPLPDVDCNVP